MHVRSSSIHLISWLLVAVSVPVGHADVVVLRDGRTLRGEVTRNTGRRIVLRTRVDGAWTDVDIRLDAVRDVFDEAGDQGGPLDAGAAVGASSPAPVPDSAPASTAPIAIIPLHGHVGGLLDGSVRGTFDAPMLTHFLDAAEARGAAIVVLDIQSPGGYLSEMETICDAIIARQGRLRIVAYAGEALSAASIIALTCRELVVRPDARVGAAVMVRDGADGVAALDAKFASPRHARQKQYMAASARPYALLAAMTIQERQLWWSPTAGFTDDAAVAAGAGDAEHLDGRTTVLTLTADEAIRFGVALGRAGNHDDLRGVLDLDAGAGVVDFTEDVARYRERTDARVVEALDRFRTYFQSLGRIHGALVQLETATGAGDVDRAESFRDEVHRLVGRSIGAARSIERQDRALLARRTDIPDAIIDQIDADRSGLERVRRLVAEKGSTAATSARAEMEGVLERWRRLMKF